MVLEVAETPEVGAGTAGRPGGGIVRAPVTDHDEAGANGTSCVARNRRVCRLQDNRGNPAGEGGQPLRMALWTACYDTVTSRQIPVQREASPQLAALADGGVLAVWIQCEGRRSNLWTSTFRSASGWSVPHAIGTGDEDRLPVLAVNSRGDATALWSSMGRLWEGRYDPASGWGPPRSVDLGSFGTPSLYMRQDGDAVAVWPESSPLTSTVWASRRVGGTWNRAEGLNVGPLGFSLTSTADAAATVTAAWSYGVGSLWVARFGFDTGWSAAEPLEESASIDLVISGSPEGSAALVWREGGSSAIRARLFTSSGGWGPAARLDAGPIRIRRPRRRWTLDPTAAWPRGTLRIAVKSGRIAWPRRAGGACRRTSGRDTIPWSRSTSEATPRRSGSTRSGME